MQCRTDLLQLLQAPACFLHQALSELVKCCAPATLACQADVAGLARDNDARAADHMGTLRPWLHCTRRHEAMTSLKKHLEGIHI